MALTKIEITINDRLSLGQLCPATDGIDRLILRKEILEKIAIRGAEAEAIGLRSEKEGNGASIKWNVEKEAAIAVEFTEGEMTYIKSVFQKLNEKKELHASQIELYQKFYK